MSDTPKMDAARSEGEMFKIGCQLERERDALVTALRACLARIESDIETPTNRTPEGDAARAALAELDRIGIRATHDSAA